jgi:hypothetical protein
VLSEMSTFRHHLKLLGATGRCRVANSIYSCCSSRWNRDFLSCVVLGSITDNLLYAHFLSRGISCLLILLIQILIAKSSSASLQRLKGDKKE